MTEESIENNFTPNALKGEEIISRVFVASAMSVQNPGFDEVDLPQEIMLTLKELTGGARAPLEENDWLCIDLNSGQVGRAFKVRDDFKILPVEVTDVQLDSAINARRMERSARARELYEQARDS